MSVSRVSTVSYLKEALQTPQNDCFPVLCVCVCVCPGRGCRVRVRLVDGKRLPHLKGGKALLSANLDTHFSQVLCYYHLPLLRLHFQLGIMQLFLSPQ